MTLDSELLLLGICDMLCYAIREPIDWVSCSIALSNLPLQPFPQTGLVPCDAPNKKPQEAVILTLLCPRQLYSTQNTHTHAHTCAVRKGAAQRPRLKHSALRVVVVIVVPARTLLGPRPARHPALPTETATGAQVAGVPRDVLVAIAGALAGVLLPVPHRVVVRDGDELALV